MHKEFDFWINNDSKTIHIIYWILCLICYPVGIKLAISAKSILSFAVIGICPYLLVYIYRSMHNPFNDIENGIENYDSLLYGKLSKDIPDQCIFPKQRGTFMFGALLKIPDEELDKNVLAFKINYYKINRAAMISLTIWFISMIGLSIYLFRT